MKIVDTINPIQLGRTWYQDSKVFSDSKAGGIIIILNEIIPIPLLKIAYQTNNKRYFFRPLADKMQDAINYNLVAKTGNSVGIWWETPYQIKDLHRSIRSLQSSVNLKNTSILFNHLSKILKNKRHVKSI